MAEKRSRTGRGGIRSREAMHALRSKPPEFDPCPPGQIGGQYRPLSEEDIRAILGTALRILEEIGMGRSPDTLTDQALRCGAFINDLGRLCFPRAMVEDIIDGAAKSFVFYGRESKYDFEVGGDRVYFGTGGAAVQTLDMESGVYRPSTLRDLYDFTRLVDCLKNVAWFTRCCVATDVPDNFDLDINTAYALLRGTRKPLGTSFFLAEHVDPIVDMFDWALGGEGKFRQRPFCKAHISPVISPLATGLAGANMVYESSGMMASLLGVSHAAFVVDDEMLSHVYRIIRGVEVNEETLGFEAIREAVTGEGHFLGGSHTMDAMQKEHYYPKLANRDDPRTWQEGGARDMWQQAHDKASQILASHYPVYIDGATDNKIRSHFNILLDQSVR